MISNKKIKELRQRIINHDVENETAIVKITAAELEELIDIIEKLNGAIEELVMD